MLITATCDCHCFVIVSIILFTRDSDMQGRIIQCARAHKIPHHWKSHHKANVKKKLKIVIEPEFVIDEKWSG